MKKRLLALLMLCIIGFSAYAQDTNVKLADKHKALANLLEQKVKQIINKSIHYNYYLGAVSYTHLTLPTTSRV